MTKSILRWFFGTVAFFILLTNIHISFNLPPLGIEKATTVLLNCGVIVLAMDMRGRL